MKTKKVKPYIIVRIPESIQKQMQDDLRRPHPHASERVGFLHTKSKWLDKKTVLVIATSYQMVDDKDYLKDSSVGAKIGADAIRSAMQCMFEHQGGCFHVHLHDHIGKPRPSGTDHKGLPGIVESLFNISKGQVTGYLILSQDCFYCAVQLAGQSKLLSADLISVVGFPLQLNYHQSKKQKNTTAFDRQSFLGSNAQFLFEQVRIGIVGYGGGGSHIGQQLAHIGVAHPVIFDDDQIEETNLNRLIGGGWRDVLRKLYKTAIAKRVIKSILKHADITAVNSRWQDAPEKLHSCDIVVGCVDSYAERQQLEAECRRYLIPYIDIGMDVYKVEEEAPAMSGQVMLTLPGSSCFWCYGFLTEEKLAKEAAKYGNVGGRPQVVWPNGILASTAVGILVDLITGWTNRNTSNIYLEYDGNLGTIKDHIRLRFCDKNCTHYPVAEAGPVRFATL